jgi:hypothetical protein
MFISTPKLNTLQLNTITIYLSSKADIRLAVISLAGVMLTTHPHLVPRS